MGSSRQVGERDESDAAGQAKRSGLDGFEHAMVAQHDVLCHRPQSGVDQWRPLHGNFHHVGHQPDHGPKRPILIATSTGQNLLYARR